jgi:hypothetical protein
MWIIVKFPIDHIGIFRDCYKDAANKNQVCYYACEQGKVPRVSKGVKWFHKVTEFIYLKTKLKGEMHLSS